MADREPGNGIPEEGTETHEGGESNGSTAPGKGLKGFFSKLRRRKAPPPPPVEEAPPPPPSPEELQRAEEERRRRAEEQEKLKLDNLVPVQDSRLYALYCRQRGILPNETPGATYSLSVFTRYGDLASAEQKQWLLGIEKEARGLRQYDADPENLDTADAVCYVRVDAKVMRAYVFVLPPVGGALPQLENLRGLLAQYGVTFGIDEEALAAACEHENLLRLLCVAEGQPPQDGKDGIIVDHYRRDNSIQLVVRDDNTIDYKDLGWLQTVKQDEVLCEIIPPVEPVPGRTVRGEEIPGKPGKRPMVPRGQGTKVNDEGDALIAVTGGVVTFKDERFRVDELLIIEGDVDIEVGNLNAVGDVIVHGDVRDGFTVEATGNVTVQGMAEGARLLAGGNIQVGLGMNGSGYGVMEAGGDILSKYIENTSVTAGGRVVCDSLVNCHTQSDDSVEVKTGRGMLIGGSVSALNRVEAQTIGNHTHRSIAIKLGSSVNHQRELALLGEKRREVQEELDKLDKDITYLKEGHGQRPEGDRGTLEELEMRRLVQRRQLGSIDRRMELVLRQKASVEHCRLAAEQLYPPVEVRIGDVAETLRKDQIHVAVVLRKGQIEVQNLWGGV